MDQQSLLYIVAAILIVVGILGVILPALPGLPLVFGPLYNCKSLFEFQISFFEFQIFVFRISP